MARNLDYRSEVAVPIYDIEIQKELQHMLDIQLKDTKKARIINKKQDNPYRTSTGKNKVRAQEAIYNYLEEKKLKFLHA